ncbi:MAG: ATP-dependent DNA ligase [Nitriliruptorales bacterium]|nr:ATP-dependent DNA ligase [Nitriliruptorales bacterium]
MSDWPFPPPRTPMEARVRDELPDTGSARGQAPGGWGYEPKWDGFRALSWSGRPGSAPEADGDARLDSRNHRPLLRYFPELRGALEQLPAGCVVDGEVVYVQGGRTDFDVLSQRIHPAESRIAKLSVETPAQLVAFDLLAIDGEDLRPAPYRERRERLEALVGGLERPWHLTPATRDRTVAEQWFTAFDSAGCDGIVAKQLDEPYVEGKRHMIKVKLRRTIDAVVGGYRMHKLGDRIGSLLLGLYDQAGQLHFVGHCSGFSDEERVALLDRITPLRVEDGFGNEARRPGEPSRWANEKTLEWYAVRPELVCEVSVDQFTGIRFRHASRFERWRPDKEPQDCAMDQIEPPPGPSFDDLVTTVVEQEGL